MKTTTLAKELAIAACIVAACGITAYAGNCLNLPTTSNCANQGLNIYPELPGYTKCWAGADVRCPRGNSPSGTDWKTVVNDNCTVDRVCETSDGTQSNQGSYTLSTDVCKKGGEVCPD